MYVCIYIYIYIYIYIQCMYMYGNICIYVCACVCVCVCVCVCTDLDWVWMEKKSTVSIHDTLVWKLLINAYILQHFSFSDAQMYLTACKCGEAGHYLDYCSCGSVIEQFPAVVGSIPKEHTYWQKNCITWMHCKSLCICKCKLKQGFVWGVLN